MKKIVNLKIRMNEEKIQDEVASISIENCFSKEFVSYINKKGKGYRVFVKIPDSEGCKELDISYQNKFPSRHKAIEEGEKFLKERFGDGIKVTYL